MRKKPENLQLEKKSVDGMGREGAKIKSKSRLFYSPMRSAETNQVIRFSMGNKVLIMYFMI